MWQYEKRLQYPVKISKPNPKIAQIIITQFGGPDGELAASMRYLSQRYTMPYKEVTGILTDIGREAPEMFHSKGFSTFSAPISYISYHLISLAARTSLKLSPSPLYTTVSWGS